MVDALFGDPVQRTPVTILEKFNENHQKQIRFCTLAEPQKSLGKKWKDAPKSKEFLETKKARKSKQARKRSQGWYNGHTLWNGEGEGILNNALTARLCSASKAALKGTDVRDLRTPSF